jgi:hypothetical protein
MKFGNIPREKIIQFVLVFIVGLVIGMFVKSRSSFGLATLAPTLAPVQKMTIVDGNGNMLDGASSWNVCPVSGGYYLINNDKVTGNTTDKPYLTCFTSSNSPSKGYVDSNGPPTIFTLNNNLSASSSALSGMITSGTQVKIIGKYKPNNTTTYSNSYVKSFTGDFSVYSSLATTFTLL